MDAPDLHTLRRRLWSDEDWYAMGAFTGASAHRRGIGYRYDDDGELAYAFRVSEYGPQCANGEIERR